MSTTGGRSASAAPQSHLQGKDERAPHAARVSASQAILDRAYGKAPTFSTTDATTFKRAIDMTDDELAAIVAKARLTVVK
jgi:hypothetical protein